MTRHLELVYIGGERKNRATMEFASNKVSLFNVGNRDPKNQRDRNRMIALYGREVFPCAHCGRPVTVEHLLTTNKDGTGIFHNASCAQKFTRSCGRQNLTNPEIDVLKSFYREVVAIPYIDIPTTRKQNWTRHPDNAHSFLGIRKNKPFRDAHVLDPQNLPKGTPKKWLDFYYGTAKRGQLPTIPDGFIFTNQKFLHLNNRRLLRDNVRSCSS